MRTAVQLSADGGDWQGLVDYVLEAEQLGVDIVWVAEAWGADAATPLAYLAARTERMLLGSGVFQLGVRSPVMTAQTALNLGPDFREPVSVGTGNVGSTGDGRPSRRGIRSPVGPDA